MQWIKMPSAEYDRINDGRQTPFKILEIITAVRAREYGWDLLSRRLILSLRCIFSECKNTFGVLVNVKCPVAKIALTATRREATLSTLLFLLDNGSIKTYVPLRWYGDAKFDGDEINCIDNFVRIRFVETSRVRCIKRARNVSHGQYDSKVR